MGIDRAPKDNPVWLFDFTGEKPEVQKAEQGLWQIKDDYKLFDTSPIVSENYIPSHESGQALWLLS